MQKIIPHEELDRRLAAAAGDLDTYDEHLDRLIAELDEGQRALETTLPETWRRAGGAANATSFAQQFRADVDAILVMEREEEARLARRIELARRRLEKARAEEGLDGDEPIGRLPRRVEQRSMELHAMRTEMVERNLYLVLINVERYVQNGDIRMDLIQEGCASLFRAVDGFDWRRGLLFRTYAVHWLNQAFRSYLYNSTHTVRVPVYLQKALKHIDQATIRIGDAKASPEEIADSSELNEKLVRAAQRASRGSYSIDAEAQDGEEGSRIRDVLVDDDAPGPYSTRLEDVSLEEGLRAAMESLGERERRVIGMRFGIGWEREHTLAEVARELGVSVERVRQIQVRALSRLNTPEFRRHMDPFLN